MSPIIEGLLGESEESSTNFIAPVSGVLVSLCKNLGRLSR